MLKTLKIENFRCFQEFELQQLGRLNLLVGTNNSGKTSILEAIQLLTSAYNLEILKDIMISRGEYMINNQLVNRSRNELDIRHLFYGHKIDIDSIFSICSSNQNNNYQKITVSIQEKKQNEFDNLRDLIIIFNWLKQDKELKIRLSSNQGIILDNVRHFPIDTKNLDSDVKTQFVTSSSLTTEKMIELFDQVVLKPEEDLVIKALQKIEPNIQRIANLSSDRYKYSRFAESRSGFVVSLKDHNQRIPIGSMGDGIWRMLGLILALVNAKNGILLVDEIDTGLHFTTMSDMWKLVWETAKELNVQVFATTHNSDCWRSLATIANAENPSEEGITIHRIEKGKNHSIVFTELEIVIAAEEDIEVR